MTYLIYEINNKQIQVKKIWNDLQCIMGNQAAVAGVFKNHAVTVGLRPFSSVLEHNTDDVLM